jgi:hypothetical protein
MMMPLAAGVLGTDQTTSSSTNATEGLQSSKQCPDSSTNTSNKQQHHGSSVECGYKAVPKTATTAAVSDVELTDIQHRNGRHRHTVHDSNSVSGAHNGMRQRIRSQSPSRTVAVTGVTISEMAVTSPHSSLLPLHTVQSHSTATDTGNDTTTATTATTANTAVSRCSSDIDAVCDDVSDHVAVMPGDILRKAVALGIAYSATLGKSCS